MPNSIKIGRIWDIPIGLHPSWFLIFALVTWSLASGYFPAEYPELAPAVYWVLGLVTSLLFFGSVLVHELAHAFVARRNGLPVEGITLFIFGGAAYIGKEPGSPGAEFRIAAAGPLASFGLAIAFEALFLLDQQIPILAAPSVWLARINLILAVFNLIPGFPLDGGRMLRAAVWRLTGSFYRATQIASAAGQVVALGFNIFGIALIVFGNFFDGLWLIFIGWFLQNAVAANLAQSSVQHLLSDAVVSQAMTPRFRQVDPLMPVQRLVNEQVLNEGHSFFVVQEDDRLVGALTLDAINAVPQRQWPFKTVNQVMLPADRLATLSPETRLLDALQTMEKDKQTHMLVTDNGEIVGVLGRDEIMQLVRVRAQLGSNMEAAA
jgi:Zn-dependent protease/predicted transcriptional regulator